MTTQGRSIVCSFGSLNELATFKDKNSDVKVLIILRRAKSFSMFESEIVLRTIERLFRNEMIESTGGDFPITKVELTEAGKSFLKENGHE